MKHASNRLTAIALLVISVYTVSSGLFERFVMGDNAESIDHSASGQVLHAGPVRVKFADGQLRYIRVGDKEIIRRIYFGVRDGNWNTAPPVYSKMDVEKADDHFTIHLAADCRLGDVDYSWTGTIIGAADGKITFQAEGVAARDFDSNRIGLCVLYGKESLAGTDFQTDGVVGNGQFPNLVSPTHLADGFHVLKYATADGLKVSCGVEGAIFDMEDQRNWGDSSWKAFAPLPYAYKHVGKGDRKSQTVTLTVSGATDAKAIPQDPVHVKIGGPVEGAKLPSFTASPSATKGDFSAINFNHAKFADKKQINWECIPTTHLPDDDTIMENVPAVAAQAKTIRSFNANCKIVVGPIHIPGKKNDEPIATAWGVAMVKSLALGGVDEADFALGHAAMTALETIRPYERRKLLNVETQPRDSHHLYAFAAENEQGVGLFLVNRTAHPCHVEIDGIGAKQLKVLLVGSEAAEQTLPIVGGTTKIQIGPYGVFRITIAK
ncbi:MAG TPA: hypothetical protein VFC46_03540 [Humisphaera sp.]|nr:hypothetical protein [Humisphaera sp.]